MLPFSVGALVDLQFCCHCSPCLVSQSCRSLGALAEAQQWALAMAPKLGLAQLAKYFVAMTALSSMNDCDLEGEMNMFECGNPLWQSPKIMLKAFELQCHPLCPASSTSVFLLV